MKRKPRQATAAAEILTGADASLLDIVDNLLVRGVMLNGELILALADVDLIYLRLSLVFCAADRVLPEVEDARAQNRKRARWQRR